MNILFDSNQKLRSGWRVLVFATVLALFGMITTGAFLGVLTLFGVPRDQDSVFLNVASSIVALCSVLAASWLCLRILEQLPFRSLGANFEKGWFRDFWIGIGAGAATFLFAVGIAVVAGLRFGVNASSGSMAITLTLVYTLVIFTFSAAFEEAFSRGYMLQTFEHSGIAWVGLVFTSLLFASLHLGNQNASLFSTINTALAGLWLGMAYLRTGALWFPFGVHLAWNWFQGSVFGVEVSGFKSLATAPLFREIDNGSQLFSGGDYGIEGGVSCTIALVVSTLLIWRFCSRNEVSEPSTEIA
ncbi:MAG: CPBP family intramembrane glutamic endopeptidase [Pyrinomonadaceae bacterium]